MSTDITNIKFEKSASNESLLQVAETRAMHEVQAAYVIAKKFPRDQENSYLNIIKSCKRPFLAEQSMYAYKRGTTIVQGASIRLAESIAQSWGNIDFGIKELTQSNGVSIAEAYAIDLETNSRVTKVFHVPHRRHTKQGITNLTDSRDIYELVANNGARRLRACILSIIPGDVVEAAVAQCKKTLQFSEVPMEDQIRNLIVGFDKFGITKEHLEKHLGHNIESTIPTEIVTLRSIYKSIKDGVADRTQFFDIALSKPVLEGKTPTAKLNTLLNLGKGSKKDKADHGAVLDNINDSPSDDTPSVDEITQDESLMETTE